MNVQAESECKAAIARSPNMLVPWYLMASYAYYEKDTPIISDGLYDAICFQLAEELDAISVDHRHAAHCDIEALDAGTGYQIKEYPAMAIGAAERFMKERAKRHMANG